VIVYIGNDLAYDLGLIMVVILSVIRDNFVRLGIQLLFSTSFVHRNVHPGTGEI
jgi:hypothetical protein